MLLPRATVRVCSIISSCYERFEDRPVFSFPPDEVVPCGALKATHACQRQWEHLLVNETSGLWSIPLNECCHLWQLCCLLWPQPRGWKTRLPCWYNLCCSLLEGHRSWATLRPNPPFVLKNLRASYRWSPQEREVKLHPLWSANALACYVEPLAPIRCMKHFI